MVEGNENEKEWDGMKNEVESKIEVYLCGRRNFQKDLPHLAVINGRTILMIPVSNFFFKNFDREERMRVFLHARCY